MGNTTINQLRAASLFWPAVSAALTWKNPQESPFPLQLPPCMFGCTRVFLRAGTHADVCSHTFWHPSFHAAFPTVLRRRQTGGGALAAAAAAGAAPGSDDPPGRGARGSQRSSCGNYPSLGSENRHVVSSAPTERRLFDAVTF